MALVDVRDMSGGALDYALYLAEGGRRLKTMVLPPGAKIADVRLLDILARDKIALMPQDDGSWAAVAAAAFDGETGVVSLSSSDLVSGSTPRIAAARARVAAVFGSFGVTLP